ncbi:uncharacterized protein LOC144101460 isoform X3 [Amblyomma americanum]
MPYSARTSTGQHCVVVGCGNNQRKRKNIADSTCAKHAVSRSQCGCDMFMLHRFLVDPELNRQWTSLVNRKDFAPTTNSRVCSLHFVDGKRTEQNPLPMLNLGYERKVIHGRRCLMRDDRGPPPVKRKRQESPSDESEASDAVQQTAPHNVVCIGHHSVSLPFSHGVKQVSLKTDAASSRLDASFEETTMAADQQNSSLSREETEMKVEKKDNSTQWELEEPVPDHTYADTNDSSNTPLTMRSIHFQYLTPQDVHFYTCLPFDAFNKLILLLRANGTKVGGILGLEQQLLLTLMRLGLGLLCGDLARRFSISIATVSTIFSSMMSTLAKVMEDIVVWLPRSVVYDSMPYTFVKNGYGRTTCIFDCTEAWLQRPKKLMARAQSYSAYKGSNTIKFLTVIAPNGLIMLVSDVYGGRASDKYIVRTCGVEDYLLPGDEIMVDRGFKLEPHLEAQGIRMNVPAFTRGKSQLSEKEVTKTRRIASLRIHVERAINRIKTYRIFKQALPIKSKKHINTIVFVCAGLCNLKGPLIKEQQEQ